MLHKQIKRKLGELFWSERRMKGYELRYVSRKTHISIGMLDFMEQGRGHNNWKKYKELLDFYGEEIKIDFQDK